MLLCLLPQYSQDIQRNKLFSWLWRVSRSDFLSQSADRFPLVAQWDITANTQETLAQMSMSGLDLTEERTLGVWSAAEFQETGSESWIILFSLQWLVGFPKIASAYLHKRGLHCSTPFPHGWLISLIHQRAGQSAGHTKSPLLVGTQKQVEEVQILDKVWDLTLLSSQETNLLLFCGGWQKTGEPWGGDKGLVITHKKQCEHHTGQGCPGPLTPDSHSKDIGWCCTGSRLAVQSRNTEVEECKLS